MKYYGLSHKYRDQTKWKSNDNNFKNKFSFLSKVKLTKNQGQTKMEIDYRDFRKKYRFSVYEASLGSSHKDQDLTRNENKIN